MYLSLTFTYITYAIGSGPKRDCFSTLDIVAEPGRGDEQERECLEGRQVVKGRVGPYVPAVTGTCLIQEFCCFVDTWLIKLFIHYVCHGVDTLSCKQPRAFVDQLIDRGIGLHAGRPWVSAHES